MYTFCLSLFIGEYLGCFYYIWLLQISSCECRSANICPELFFILLGIYLEIEIADSYGNYIFSVLRHHTVSIVVSPSYIPAGIVWEVFSGSHILTNIYFVVLSWFGHPNGIKWYLIVILWFSYYISLMSVAVEHLFMWLLAICKYSLEKYLLVFCLIFNPIVVCSSLYILDVNSLPDIWFEDNFSYSVDCLFTLLIVSFDG